MAPGQDWTGVMIPEGLIIPVFTRSTLQGLKLKVPAVFVRLYVVLQVLPVRFKQKVPSVWVTFTSVLQVLPVRLTEAVVVWLEAITMPGVIASLSDNLLLATVPVRFVYSSTSMPAAAFGDRFSQWLILLPEIFNVRDSVPMET